MRTPTQTIKLALVLCVFTVSILSNYLAGNAQKVIYKKGVIIKPSNLQKGDVLRVGDVISTAKGGRVILKYTWPSEAPGFPCQTWWVVNGGMTVRVPKLNNHPPNCPVSESVDPFDENAKGIGRVSFFTHPGKGKGPEAMAFDYTRKKEGEVLKALAKLPTSLLGVVTSVDTNAVTVESQTGSEKISITFRTTPSTALMGVTSLEGLKGNEVYAEYISAETNEVRIIMPVKSKAFYEFNDFEEQRPYAGDCDNLTKGNSCVRFDDGYVWLVHEKAISWDVPERIGPITIQKALGARGEYQHISGTSFVRQVILDLLQ